MAYKIKILFEGSGEWDKRNPPEPKVHALDPLDTGLVDRHGNKILKIRRLGFRLGEDNG